MRWLSRACEAVNVEAGRYVLEGAFEAFDVGVELTDVVLKSFDPTLLLSKTLATFFLAVADKFRNVVGQPLVLHVVDIGEGGADSGEDGRGEGSCMYRWLCWSMRYGGSVEETGGSLNEVGFP